MRYCKLLRVMVDEVPVEDVTKMQFYTSDILGSDEWVRSRNSYDCINISRLISIVDRPIKRIFSVNESDCGSEEFTETFIAIDPKLEEELLMSFNPKDFSIMEGKVNTLQSNLLRKSYEIAEQSKKLLIIETSTWLDRLKWVFTGVKYEK